MNSELLKLFREDETYVPFNDLVVKTKSSLDLQDIMKYVDDRLKSAIGEIGYFKYIGIEKVNFYDELLLLPDKPRIEEPIGESSFRKVKIIFEYNGVRREHYTLLPFVNELGIIKISGTSSYIQPVLIDPVLSPVKNGIFANLPSDKINFLSETFGLNINNEIYPSKLYYSNELYRVPKGVKNNVGDTSNVLSLYDLRKFGMRETFNIYGIDNVNILNYNDAIKLDTDKFKIISTSGTKLPRIKTPYPKLPYCIVIETTKTLTAEVLSLCGEILYVLSLFSSETENLILALKDNNLDAEKIIFNILHGMIIFKNGYSISRSSMELLIHDTTLMSMIDKQTTEEMRVLNVEVNNALELFRAVRKSYVKWTMSTMNNIDDYSLKRLTILKYLMYPLDKAINMTAFELRKKEDKLLKEHELKAILQDRRRLSPRTMMSINSGMRNIVLLPVEVANSNYLHKLSMKCEIQPRAKGTFHGKDKYPKSVRGVTAYSPFIGNIACFPKTAPIATISINPRLVVDREHRPVLDKDTATIEWLKIQLEKV